MSRYFPVCVDLGGRRCLVVGGGAVGTRKVLALLASGARVRLASPTATPTLQALAGQGRIEHRRRGFRAGDLAGVTLAIAATGVPRVDAAVAAAARRRGVLVNAVDRPALCDFILPSVLRRGALQVAVSTGGRSPALAREIRRRLEALFPPETADLVERAGRARRLALARAVTPAARARVAELVAARALRPRGPLGHLVGSGWAKRGVEALAAGSLVAVNLRRRSDRGLARRSQTRRLA